MAEKTINWTALPYGGGDAEIGLNKAGTASNGIYDWSQAIVKTSDSLNGKVKVSAVIYFSVQGYGGKRFQVTATLHNNNTDSTTSLASATSAEFSFNGTNYTGQAISFDFGEVDATTLNSVQYMHLQGKLAYQSSSSTSTAQLFFDSKGATFSLTYTPGAQVYYGVNGEWKPVTVYYGVNGVWKEAQVSYGTGGAWKP